MDAYTSLKQRSFVLFLLVIYVEEFVGHSVSDWLILRVNWNPAFLIGFRGYGMKQNQRPLTHIRPDRCRAAADVVPFFEKSA